MSLADSAVGFPGPGPDGRVGAGASGRPATEGCGGGRSFEMWRRSLDS